MRRRNGSVLGFHFGSFHASNQKPQGKSDFRNETNRESWVSDYFIAREKEELENQINTPKPSMINKTPRILGRKPDLKTR